MKTLKKEIWQAGNLPDKLSLQKKMRPLEQNGMRSGAPTMLPPKNRSLKGQNSETGGGTALATVDR